MIQSQHIGTCTSPLGVFTNMPRAFPNGGLAAWQEELWGSNIYPPPNDLLSAPPDGAHSQDARYRDGVSAASNVFPQQHNSNTRPSNRSLLERLATAEPDARTLLPCEFCGRRPKNPSDARRHLNIHIRPFICLEENCPATRGFASKNDLERHKKCVHGIIPEAGPRVWYICPIGGRDGCRKLWPRMDNLRTHVVRNHPGCEGVPPLLVDPDMDHTP